MLTFKEPPFYFCFQILKQGKTESIYQKRINTISLMFVESDLNQIKHLVSKVMMGINDKYYQYLCHSVVET